MNKFIRGLSIGICLLILFSTITTTAIQSNSIITGNGKEKLETNNVILNLERGDIVWRYVDEEIAPLWSFMMHPMMCTGRTRSMIDGIYYEFVEAHGAKGVCYSLVSKNGIINDSKLFDFIYRVNCTSPQQVENAISFAEYQVGSNFVPVFENPIKNYHPKEDNTWYCTELVWAAYFNCDHHPSEGIYGFGIDIDANKGLIISPEDIHNSQNIINEPLFLTCDHEEQVKYNSPMKQNVKEYPILVPLFRKFNEFFIKFFNQFPPFQELLDNLNLPAFQQLL